MSAAVESVWDYPRPPRVETSSRELVVVLGGIEVARTTAALRVLETSHPPNYYLPRECFAAGVVRDVVGGTTVCEFKGVARYADLVAGGQRARRAAWHYPEPRPGYEDLVGHLAVMPALVDGCFVDGERVTPQEGGFYGGWITSDVSGPFKGAPGTGGW